MRRTIAWVALVTASWLGSVGAQAPAQKPGSEHKKLEYFVGKWTSTGEMKASPFGPGGKITASDTCEWFQGGFAVVCHSQGTGPAGPAKSIGIMGYSPEEKKYTYFGLDNTAMFHDDDPERDRRGQHLDLHGFRDDGGPSVPVAVRAEDRVADVVHIQVGNVGPRQKMDADSRGYIDEDEVAD